MGIVYYIDLKYIPFDIVKFHTLRSSKASTYTDTLVVVLVPSDKSSIGFIRNRKKHILEKKTVKSEIR